MKSRARGKVFLDLITCWLVATVMCLTVDLYQDARLQTGEVEDETFERKLAAEFEARWSGSKLLP